MRFALVEHFGRYPSQAKVAKLLLSNGMSVRGGRVSCGGVEIADVALARAAGVDRRIVRAAVEAIEADDRLRRLFSALAPTAMLKDVAPAMGWSCIEIIPTDAHAPGILADVTAAIAENGISVRQALVDDPELVDEPRLYVITDSEVPPEMIPRIKASRGVKSILIH